MALAHRRLFSQVACAQECLADLECERALVTDLPARVRQGDLTASDARALLMRLLADVEPDAGRREARLGDTMSRVEAASRAAAQALADSGKAVVPVPRLEVEPLDQTKK